MKEISTSQGLTTYQIDVGVEAGNTLTVRVQDPKWDTELFESEFTVVQSVPSSPAPIAIHDISTEISSWTCSFQKTHNLRLTHAAPAFRVEWSTTKSDYVAGNREIVVVPSHMGSFFDSGRSATTIAPAVELGHINCFGHTLEWTASDPVIVGITALFPDAPSKRSRRAP